MNAGSACRYSPHLMATLLVVSVPGQAGEPASLPNMLRFANPTGFAATHSFMLSGTSSIKLTSS